MSWRIIPGVRQDHRGRYYQTAVNSRGKEDIVFVPPPPLSARALRALQPVHVTSLVDGHEYVSSACYQPGFYE